MMWFYHERTQLKLTAQLLNEKKRWASLTSRHHQPRQCGLIQRVISAQNDCGAAFTRHWVNRSGCGPLWTLPDDCCWSSWSTWKQAMESYFGELALTGLNSSELVRRVNGVVWGRSEHTAPHAAGGHRHPQTGGFRLWLFSGESLNQRDHLHDSYTIKPLSLYCLVNSLYCWPLSLTSISFIVVLDGTHLSSSSCVCSFPYSRRPQ